MDLFRKIDLHMHTTVSDGTDTPEEILDRVRDAGITLFSVTDHDSAKASGIIPAIRTPEDPLFESGVEFSCKDEDGQYHILGYGYDPAAASIRDMVDKSHSLRLKKVRKRLDFLRDRFGFVFPEAEIGKLFRQDNPGKPHIGNLMVRYGYAESKEQAIKGFINQVHFPNEYIRPEEAITAILEGGGVPVLAHPFYGSGDQLILGEDMEMRIRKLMDFGLQGVEAYYSGFTWKLTRQMLAYAVQFDLFVTAGSDYHGTNKLVTLGDTGLTEGAELPEGLIRFIGRIMG